MPESTSRPAPEAVPQPPPRPTPRFTVIVPAHGVAGRLSQALDSVLTQAGRGGGAAGGGSGAGVGPGVDGALGGDGALGVEVVVVCGAPDGLDGAVAARYAARDSRVRVVFSTPDAGLGGARNTGLAVARGDYVVFLDGDDTLAPGALDAVAGRLAETGEVDVLVVGHERVHWWRGPQPGDPLGELLRTAPDRAVPDGAVPDGAPHHATADGGTGHGRTGHDTAADGGTADGGTGRYGAAAVPEGVFAPADAPWLSGTTLPAWSAVHRRAFLAGHGLAFPAGGYTDTGFCGLEMLAARRVAVLERVCVRHLLRRQGNLLRSPGVHHFDLLQQVDLVLTRAREDGRTHGRAGARQGMQADAPPDTPPDTPPDGQPGRQPDAQPDGAALGPARLHVLFTHLMAQVLRTAAAAPELLPDDAPVRGAREFFERAAELYRVHRPDGFRPPAGRVGVQHRLLAGGSYGAFAALRGAHRQASRAVRGARTAAGRIRAHRPAHLGAYRAALRRPVDANLAVYCAYWGRGYSCNPAAIHAAARRLAPHIRSVFLVTEEAAERMPAGVEYAVLGTPRAWEVLGRARFLINNANFANPVVKRPGTVHLQTQHGTPLKKMGIEQAEYPVVAAHSGGFGRLLARVDRWDYNLSSNRHSTEVWEREFPADYEMLEYGYPRNDVYQHATAADVARIRRALGVPEDRTAILYAPTHRDYRTAYRAQLDLDEFCAAAGEEFVVLLRAHYFYEPAGTGGGQDGARDGARVIDVTGHPSAEEVCLAADALVTDYSSIMFDYANLDRPIVVYADDWDVYRETRGVTFDVTACPPGPVARTEAELARTFQDGSWAGARAAQARARFRERFCTFDDGRAAERVVRRVLLGEPPEALPPVIPPAARTPAPAARAARRAATEPAAAPTPAAAPERS